MQDYKLCFLLCETGKSFNHTKGLPVLSRIEEYEVGSLESEYHAAWHAGIQVPLFALHWSHTLQTFKERLHFIDWCAVVEGGYHIATHVVFLHLDLCIIVIVRQSILAISDGDP